MSLKEKNTIGPASPILFYGILLLVTVLSGYYIYSAKFEWTPVAKNTVMCLGEEEHYSGEEVFHAKSNKPRILRAGGSISIDHTYEPGGRHVKSVTIKYNGKYRLLKMENLCDEIKDNKVFEKGLLKRVIKNIKHEIKSDGRLVYRYSSLIDFSGVSKFVGFTPGYATVTYEVYPRRRKRKK